MTIALTVTDALQMADVLATGLALSTTETLTLSDHFGIDHQLAEECPQLPYNTPTCAILPDAAQQVRELRVSDGEYQQDKEKEGRVPVHWKC